MIFGYKHELRGGHVHVDVFAGENPAALGKAGTLVFRQDEFTEFRASIEEAGGEWVGTIFVFEDITEEITP